MARKRKRNVYMLGSRTHGFGSHKKHRGKGSKGGKGYAGSTGHRKTWLMKYEPDHIGKSGFKSLGQRNICREKIKAVNISDLQKLAERNGMEKEVDVDKLGYNKVLGKGKIEKPLIIKAAYFSGKAKERIEAAGGKAISTKEAE